MLVMLDSDGHYPDQFWEMSEEDYKALRDLLDSRDYYLDAAAHNSPYKRGVIDGILARSKRLPAVATILKYC